MIKEDYCSYEVAKLLKEKGFHEPCIATYNSTTKNFQVEEIYEDWTIHWKGYISAPTLQVAMKWLREVHNIDICVFPYQADYISYSYKVKIYKNKEIYLTITDSKTYEDAVEEALKYCLDNLI